MHATAETGPGPVRQPESSPGGPLPLTMRQGAIAAVLVLVVGLGAALLTPLAAAVEAGRVKPPGSLAVGRAVVLPAAGWTVESQQSDAVLLSRAGPARVGAGQGGHAPRRPAGRPLGCGRGGPRPRRSVGRAVPARGLDAPGRPRRLVLRRRPAVHLRE